MLDGAARVNDVVAAVRGDGQPAVAITDHGVMYGAVDFYKAATASGVKPIIGIEAYVTPGSRFDRPPRRDDVRYHMTLLATSEVGYRNLMTMSSRAFLDGFYYKPRMDRELLAAHSEGIVATSGCLGGHVAQLLAPDAASEEGNIRQVRDYRAAVEAAAMYQDIFGRGQLLHRDPGPRHPGAAQGHARPPRGRPRGGCPAAGHQRQPLHVRRRGGQPRRAAVHPDRCQPRRPRGASASSPRSTT